MKSYNIDTFSSIFYGEALSSSDIGAIALIDSTNYGDSTPDYSTKGNNNKYYIFNESIDEQGRFTFNTNKDIINFDKLIIYDKNYNKSSEMKCNYYYTLNRTTLYISVNSSENIESDYTINGWIMDMSSHSEYPLFSIHSNIKDFTDNLDETIFNYKNSSSKYLSVNKLDGLNTNVDTITNLDVSKIYQSSLYNIVYKDNLKDRFGNDIKDTNYFMDRALRLFSNVSPKSSSDIFGLNETFRVSTIDYNKHIQYANYFFTNSSQGIIIPITYRGFIIYRYVYDTKVWRVELLPFTILNLANINIKPDYFEYTLNPTYDEVDLNSEITKERYVDEYGEEITSVINRKLISFGNYTIEINGEPKKLGDLDNSFYSRSIENLFDFNDVLNNDFEKLPILTNYSVPYFSDNFETLPIYVYDSSSLSLCDILPNQISSFTSIAYSYRDNTSKIPYDYYSNKKYLNYALDVIKSIIKYCDGSDINKLKSSHLMDYILINMNTSFTSNNMQISSQKLENRQEKYTRQIDSKTTLNEKAVKKISEILKLYQDKYDQGNMTTDQESWYNNATSKDILYDYLDNKNMLEHINNDILIEYIRILQFTSFDNLKNYIDKNIKDGIYEENFFVQTYYDLVSNEEFVILMLLTLYITEMDMSNNFENILYFNDSYSINILNNTEKLSDIELSSYIEVACIDGVKGYVQTEKSMNIHEPDKQKEYIELLKAMTGLVEQYTYEDKNISMTLLRLPDNYFSTALNSCSDNTKTKFKNNNNVFLMVSNLLDNEIPLVEKYESKCLDNIETRTAIDFDVEIEKWFDTTKLKENKKEIYDIYICSKNLVTYCSVEVDNIYSFYIDNDSLICKQSNNGEYWEINFNKQNNKHAYLNGLTKYLPKADILREYISKDLNNTNNILNKMYLTDNINSQNYVIRQDIDENESPIEIFSTDSIRNIINNPASFKETSKASVEKNEEDDYFHYILSDEIRHSVVKEQDNYRLIQNTSSAYRDIEIDSHENMYELSSKNAYFIRYMGLDSSFTYNNKLLTLKNGNYYSLITNGIDFSIDEINTSTILTQETYIKAMISLANEIIWLYKDSKNVQFKLCDEGILVIDKDTYDDSDIIYFYKSYLVNNSNTKQTIFKYPIPKKNISNYCVDVSNGYAYIYYDIIDKSTTRKKQKVINLDTSEEITLDSNKTMYIDKFNAGKLYFKDLELA